MNWNFDEHVSRESLQETEARVLSERVRAQAERDAQFEGRIQQPRRNRIIALLLVSAAPVVAVALLYAAN